MQFLGSLGSSCGYVNIYVISRGSGTIGWISWTRAMSGSDPSMELGQKIRGDPPAAFRQRQSAGHFGSHTSVFVNPASQKPVI